MFVDELEIKIQAGEGGDGAVSFHHEKYRPRGGPDGGDGGRGGDVIFRADLSCKDLSSLKLKGGVFKAESGKDGGRNNRSGQAGRDLIIRVPCGTELIDPKTNLKIVDLVSNGESVTLAYGARGGRGNARFATSTNQLPGYAEKGGKTEPKSILLRFKMVADVGLVGYPNTGKSTLLSRLTSARPKIADYPFTTTHPNLGVIQTEEFLSFVVIDMPALIEGASSGNGLGNRFLRHLERVKVLVHLLDITQKEVIRQFDLLNGELRLFNESLVKRPQLVALNKIDLLEDESRLKEVCGLLIQQGYEVIPTSALTTEGLERLKEKLIELLFRR